MRPNASNAKTTTARHPGPTTPMVGLLLAAALGISIAYGMLLLLPLYVQRLGGNEAHFGIILSAAAIPAILCLSLLNRHPNALRPPWVLALAITSFAVGSASAATVTDSWEPLIAIGMLLGTAWAVVYTAAPMVISTMATDQNRATFFGYLTGSQQLGIGLGPVIAGTLVLTPLGFRGTFVLAGLLCLVALACTTIVAARTVDQRATRIPHKRDDDPTSPRATTGKPSKPLSGSRS